MLFEVWTWIYGMHLVEGNESRYTGIGREAEKDDK